MKRNGMLGTGVALLVLAAGCAGTSEAKRDVEGAIAGIEESTEGMVVAVHGDELEVRSAEDPDAAPMRFERTADTDLVRNDRPFSWVELSEGMPVRVHFEAKGGSEQATRIEILTGPEADEVRRKASGRSGWSRPEGVGTPPDQGSTRPSEMPGVDTSRDGTDVGGGAETEEDEGAY